VNGSGFKSGLGECWRCVCAGGVRSSVRGRTGAEMCQVNSIIFGR